MDDLLTRDIFRESVFNRDKGKCVFCNLPAIDAHHILERRLWGDGGYYIDNGASLCESHHIKCETTEISAEDVREACGISKKVIPAHLYSDQVYDKWGNPILPNGKRLRGELFFDESVQKALKDFINLFTYYVKYPRTYHLPWSENMNNDDRMMNSLSQFDKMNIVVTEKMDGENTTLYNDYIHARSLDSQSNSTRDWVKSFWSKICYDIPEGWRICGENLYATHSIKYNELPSYFMGFSIWNERNICLDWDETLYWFDLLNIIPVNQLYRGIWDIDKIKGVWLDKNSTKSEGYVVRITDSFTYKDFNKYVGKFVRKNHIQTVKHWMMGQKIEYNSLLIK